MPAHRPYPRTAADVDFTSTRERGTREGVGVVVCGGVGGVKGPKKRSQSGRGCVALVF
jgi:hypothetical protein